MSRPSDDSELKSAHLLIVRRNGEGKLLGKIWSYLPSRGRLTGGIVGYGGEFITRWSLDRPVLPEQVIDLVDFTLLWKFVSHDTRYPRSSE